MVQFGFLVGVCFSVGTGDLECVGHASARLALCSSLISDAFTELLVEPAFACFK